jgi:hypothetical protein
MVYCEIIVLSRGNPGHYPCVMLPMTDDLSVRPPRQLTPEEKKAREDARRADAEQAMREYAAAQKAFHKNRERLKAERLAREAMLASRRGEGSSP